MLGFNLCAFKCSDSAGSAMLQALNALLSLKNKQKNKDVFFGKHSPSETLPAASKHPAALGR